MPSGLMPAAVLPLAWAAAVAIADYRWQRIPNGLLLLALLPGLLWLCWTGETPLGIGWFDALCGCFAGFFLTLPGHVAAKLGAGDVKLAAVLGLMQGLHGVLITLLIGALLLGAASLLVVLHLGRQESAAIKLPAGVALCVGFVVALALGHWLPW